MSIRIDHGPAGSYKTSGVIADMFIPAAKEGRLIVTNIRGINSREHVSEILGDLPETFDLIHLPTSDHIDAQKNRDYLARFFHWLPIGALLIVDEAQMVFPKSWRDSDLKKLDYPGGAQQADIDRRPKDFLTAWDMHRHWNWDICLTTTKIRKIRDDIRDVADMAYRHRDMALIGWSGRYFETKHQPEDLGSADSDQISTTTKKIPSIVWKLYESTATGTYTKTKSGFNFLKTPKMVLLLLVMAYLIYSLSTSDAPFSGHDKTVVKNDIPSKTIDNNTIQSGIEIVNKQNDTGVNVNVHTIKNGKDVLLKKEPFQGFYIRLSSLLITTTGKTKEYSYNFELINKQMVQRVRGIDLIANGYNIEYIGNCLLKLVYNDTERYITCSKPIYTKRTDNVATNNINELSVKPMKNNDILPNLELVNQNDQNID